MDDGSITSDVFLDVMGNVAASVTIVTATHEGRHHGLTVSAFSSVSLDPPLVLVCIDKGSHSLPAISGAGGFTVNFLSSNAGQTAMLFASKSEDKFEEISHRPAVHPTAGPWLPEHSYAYFECETTHEVDAGDHIVFIGEVKGGQRVAPDLPLVYCRRQFADLGLES